MSQANPWIIVAALSGGVAAFCGAYGWNWLEADDAGREIFNMGVQYQMWHSLALLAIAWFTSTRPQTDSGWAQARSVTATCRPTRAPGSAWPWPSR